MSKSKRMRWAGHVARTGEKQLKRVFVGNHEGTRPLEKPMCRWENITVDVKQDESVD
jgi:hypothetical protein